MTPDDLEPDTKDWTWVLDSPCPECGFDASSVRPTDVAEHVRRNAAAWPARLAGPGVGARPRPGTWSVLEYGCHVRDVHRIFRQRVRLMLDEDEPRFPNWDQDETALADDYASQRPGDRRRRTRRRGRCRRRHLCGGARRRVVATGAAEQRQRVHRGVDRRLPPARRGPPRVGRRPRRVHASVGARGQAVTGPFASRGPEPTSLRSTPAGRWRAATATNRRPRRDGQPGGRARDARSSPGKSTCATPPDSSG